MPLADHQINTFISGETYDIYLKLHRGESQYTWREIIEIGVLQCELEESKKKNEDSKSN